MNILYKALKHVIRRFRIYNYFRKIFKFRDFMNTLRNSSKSRFNRIFAKFKYLAKHNIIFQNKRMRWCGVPPPPPIIFERLTLPQQIIYRRKENLSESPNHFKYRTNILISRFYEQFSRSSQNLGHFWKYEKI